MYFKQDMAAKVSMMYLNDTVRIDMTRNLTIISAIISVQKNFEIIIFLNNYIRQ